MGKHQSAGMAAGRPSDRAKEKAIANAATIEADEQQALTVLVPASEKKRVRLYAMESGRSVSAIMRQLIAEHIPKT